MFIASSLDGLIAREDGSIDWLFTYNDFGYQEFYQSVDAVIMGRKTYEKGLAPLRIRKIIFSAEICDLQIGRKKMRR